jgi:hypothetical protein
VRVSATDLSNGFVLLQVRPDMARATGSVTPMQVYAIDSAGNIGMSTSPGWMA